MHYFLTINGSSVGPMTKEQIMSYNVNPDTPVSKDGGPWAPLYTYPELMQVYQSYSAAGRTVRDQEVQSKKVLCGILAILVGSLGVQYFVLGKVAGGFITILLSLVTCGLWSIVTLIQGIMMLVMSDADFERKYVQSTSVLPLF